MPLCNNANSVKDSFEKWTLKYGSRPFFDPNSLQFGQEMIDSKTCLLKLPSHTRGASAAPPPPLVFYLKLETTRCLNNRFTYFIIHIHVLKILDFEKKRVKERTILKSCETCKFFGSVNWLISKSQLVWRRTISEFEKSMYCTRQVFVSLSVSLV